MSIEFVDPKGNPVILRRPDLIIALRSYTRPHPETGEVKIHTIAIYENREAVFIDAEPAVVETAIVEHERTENGGYVSAEPEAHGYTRHTGYLR